MCPWKFFDKNGDNSISPEEMRAVLQESLKQAVSDHELDSMIKQADVDGDGKISFEEFKRIMSC